MKYNFLAVLGFHILMALAVNRLYIIHAKIIGKLAKKSNDRKNNPKTEEELEEVMRIRGRVSFISALLTVCLFVASVFAIARYFLKDNDLSKIINKSISGVSIQKDKVKVFDGKIVFDKSEDIYDYINVKIPELFIGTNDMYIESAFTTMSKEENNQCKIRLGILEEYNDGNSFIVKLAAFNEEEDKVDKKETKGIEWTNYYTEDENDIIYYKGTTIDEHALVLEYRIGKNSTENICDAYYLTIMESLELKGD